MTAFILIGLIALISGILFLVAPGMLIKLSGLLNQIVSTDHKTLKYRISVGIIFIIIGLFFLFMAYYFSNPY
ncbi:MAG: hypothetical protein RAO92_04150 [Candidatus Euphemobacter frigidus]|nr:hypothetical protein [Candidatus Euphemobacter frigidus]MDP8275577.1 hypothetical protein [Candidatus Euphemobacter frigidus]